jgi:hypothetical protein
MSDVITAPDFVQPSTIDFSSLYEKAMAHPSDPTVDDLDPAPAAPSEPAPVTSVTTSAPPTSQSSQPAVIDLPDDAMVRVKIDGVEQTVPFREYKDGVQREAVFTKRMQQLAEQRREAEAVFTQRAAELQRQAEMIAYAQQQLQRPQAAPTPQTPPAAPDPNEIATLGEVQQSLATFQQQLAAQQAAQQQAFFQQLQQAGDQLREEQAIQADAARFSTALKTTLDQDDYRVLRDAVPYAEESIRFQVAQLNPQSIDEAIQFTDHVVKEWATKLKSTSQDYLTRQEVAKARAKMEPPAGSPPPPVAQRAKSAFRKTGQIDWDLLRDRAASLL